MVVVGGEFWDFAVKDGPIDREDWKQCFGLAGGGPVSGAPLWIRIDEQYSGFCGERDRMTDVNGEGCFAYAAFLILDGNNHGVSLVWAVIRIQDFSGFTINLISVFQVL